MKKIVFLMIIICLVSSACNSKKDTVRESNKNENNSYSAAPSVSSIGFYTFSELQKALKPQNENKLYCYFKDHGVDGEHVKTVQIMIESIRLHNNIVPYTEGHVIGLRNEEGFDNIAMYSSEKYGLPCIFFHPYVLNGDNLYIKITCIPEDILTDYTSLIASDLVKIMAPEYPNIDNFGSYCRSVYNTKVQLSDREVTALVYEYSSDARNSTIFIYDNLLVEVRNNPEIWGADWFANLSFGSF